MKLSLAASSLTFFPSSAFAVSIQGVCEVSRWISSDLIHGLGVSGAFLA
jgi:hypothetical protein